MELGWLFGTVSAWYLSPPQKAQRWGCSWSEAERRFSDTMIALWARFAATGAPLAPGPPAARENARSSSGWLAAPKAWPAYTQAQPQRLNFRIGSTKLWPEARVRHIHRRRGDCGVTDARIVHDWGVMVTLQNRL